MMWPASRIRVVEGSIDSDILKIIKWRLVQQMKDGYLDGTGIFQQDNTSAMSSENQKKSFNVWASLHGSAPCSPDVNPIESIWSLVKKRVSKEKSYNKNKVISHFLKI